MGRPWLTMLLCLVVLGTLGSGVTGLGLSSNYRSYFGPQNPELLAFDNFQDTYTKNDNIFFLIKPDDNQVFTPRIMEAVEKLTERAWQIPHVLRVDSVTNFQYTHADGDELIVEDLVRNGIDMDAETLAEKARIATAEPLLYHRILNEDLSATAINATLHYPEKDGQEVLDAVHYARDLANEIRAEYPEVTIALTGLSMLNASFVESGRRDAISLIPAMYLILFIAMLVVLRSITASIGTFLVIVLSSVTALGAIGHFGILLTPVSLSAPTIITTLAIADSIHILVSMLTFMRDGMDKRSALRESMRVNFLAVSVTSLTTIIGFLALNFSDSPPFHDLGNITAVGIFAAWFYSITFLPSFISLLPVKTKATGKGETLGERVMDALADAVIDNRRPILWIGSAIAIIFIAAVPQLELNDEWVKYFDRRIEFRRDSDFALEHLPDAYPIEYSVEATGPEGISDPEYLQNLEKLTRWLREQPEIQHVYSMTDIMKRLNKNLHEDDPDYYRLPNNRQLAAQYLFLYELSLPYGLDLNDRINIDKSSTRVTATAGVGSTVALRGFLDRADTWMDANLPEHMRARATSATVMFAYISERNIKSMIFGNVIAVVLISMVLMLALRSVSLGAMSLIPNVLPILMTYGIWTLLVGKAGMAAATVSATSIGIIVDDTVHFLAKYLRGRRERHLDKAEAIRHSFHTVGLAIFANSVILVAGFMFLTLSTFKINFELGFLTALAIAVALVFDFLMLPALLLVGHKPKIDVSAAIGEGVT